MKRILFIALFFLLATVSFGQYVNTQTIGSNTTLFKSKGGLASDSSFILLNNYADTTAANFSVSKNYMGSFIRVGSVIWMRGSSLGNTTPNRWYEFAVVGNTGTVTLVSGNSPISVANGSTTPTISIDTAYGGVTTKRWLYKAVDSLGAVKLGISDTATMLNGYVRKTRLINTNAPLAGGGSLTNDLTLAADTGRSTAQLVAGGSLNKVRDSLVALISSSGDGTVLSVATTDGVGVISSVANPTSNANISIRVDTLAISTKLNVQKVKDSLVGMIALKLNISDTAAMLANRLKISDTATMLANRLKISDTATMLSKLTLDRVLANGNVTGRNAFLGYIVSSGASVAPTVTGLYLFDQRLLSIQSGGNSRPLAVDAQYVAFGTGNTYSEKARIDSFGSLLIGTSTSNAGAYKLDVSGSARVSTLPSFASGGTYVVSNSGILSSRTSAEVLADIGAGSVTSVALSMPAIFSVSGSPITTSGTLSVSLANQNANLVLASPTTGSPAQPSFRSLVNDDLPTVSVSKGGTGLTSLTSGRIPFGQGTSAFGNTSSLTWDGTFLMASNFLPASSTGAYTLAGSSGGNTEISFDGSNKVIFQSDFDSLRFQAGSNDANKRFGNFYTGNTRVAYWADDGFMYLDPSITLTDNSQKFATTAFVKGQGYLTSGSALSSATGTANQVLVNGTSGSAQTGAITLTTPQSIGTSSNVQFGTILGQASTTYSSGTIYSIAANPTITFSGTLPTSGVSFSSILSPFNNVISDNTTVNGNTPFGSVLASNSLSFSNASYRTLTMSASSGGIKANSALIASTFDAGTERGAVTHSAGIMINGIFKSGTYSLRRQNHYQLLINGVNEFGNADSITSKFGIYQSGTDTNYLNGNFSAPLIAARNGLFYLDNFTGNNFIQQSSGSFFIANNGNINFTINGSGNIRFNAYGAGTLTTDASGNITASSDTSMKHLIKPLDNVLLKIMDFEPYYFKWKERTGLDTLNQYLSITAQSIKKSFPIALGKSADGTLTVQDRAVLAIAIKAIQELKLENDNLKKENNLINERLKKIEDIIYKIKP